MATKQLKDATKLHDLIDLVSSSDSSTTLYPSEDTLLSALNARFRSDLPYTRIGSSGLVVINPIKSLANTNEASAQDYEEKTYRDVEGNAPQDLIQPHIYELASRVYLLLRRTNRSQSVVFRGITGSGKTHSARLLTNQILRLSALSKKDLRVAEQVKALNVVLESFGHAKTPLNASASRYTRYQQLYFSDKGRIIGAKTLAFALDKSRLVRLAQEERSFHIFYQFLAGATPEERDLYNLEDPSDYALLASSGCYRLPAGPFSDDSMAMEELRVSMKTLGLKSKHITSIFSLVVVILLLGNLRFIDLNGLDESARVANPEVLAQISHLLGVSPEDFEQALTNKTNYVRKELYTVFLAAEACKDQVNRLAKDLYAILFAYIVEMANMKLDPTASGPQLMNQILFFDQPGFQSRAPTGSVGSLSPVPLVAANGQNSFEEFSVNFTNEMIHAYILRKSFEDTDGYSAQVVADGITLPHITTMDNSACIELLRGTQLSNQEEKKPGGLLGIMTKASNHWKQGKSPSGGPDAKDEELLRDMAKKYGVHASFVSNASDRNLFAVNHYSGQCTYDVRGFVEKDTDLLDSAFVFLLRHSTDTFVARLVSGPSLATEQHSQDTSMVVQAQVSSMPLRSPTSAGGAPLTEGLDPTRVYPVTTQLNFTISQLLRNLDQTQLWTVSCIRPNDSGSPNSFDKRRVKSQIRSLLLPDLVSRKKLEYLIDYDQDEFCERYSLEGVGEIAAERIRAFARGIPWMKEGPDYAVGHSRVWFSYLAWKAVDDGLRADEKDERLAAKEAESMAHVGGVAGDDATTVDHHQHPSEWRSLGGPDYGESVDDLLLRRPVTHGAGYIDANILPGSAGPETPLPNSASTFVPAGRRSTANPFNSPADNKAGWGRANSWDDSKDPPDAKAGVAADDASTKEGAAFVVKETTTIEEVPTSAGRRWWVRWVWFVTWWIPSFLLNHVGRMKRPDVRMAWREKVTICFMIFGFCGIVIFYIIAFGLIVCPEFNKAWTRAELEAHTNDNDFWVAVYGRVYDISDFWRGSHGVVNKMSDTSTMQALAGQDITAYFPIPWTVSCPGLVQDETLTLNLVNATEYAQAVHTSGALQSVPNTHLNDPNWYTTYFMPRLKGMQKGQLVFDKNVVKRVAQADDSLVKWAIWNDGIYDLSDYFYTLQLNGNAARYSFLDDSITQYWTQQAGQDVSDNVNAVLKMMDPTKRAQIENCLQNAFYRGRTDFRTTARCQAPNMALLAFSGVICAIILVKFLAALQLTGKRNPEMLDKFIICQVPCYTEGEESLRRTIDSLVALNYDDKRKLIFIICDGNIIGSGNDRTTPRIALDILGVDPKLDPEPLLFKSIAEGSKQLNYGKVYSGLYEHEGHVVPYMVVVKVGKPSERSKPGNRGKRDSQILLLHYLNRVHFDAPMSPLELEIYHQMRNVIGIDPAFYEYIFMVDADTSVTPDSLNRLVACTADDSQIIAICGETKLDNEEGSWWTMIQVYEYYISHHLSKAFESLFGSVTCLPGCFSMYRIRTADKGRPLIISNRVIDDYSECIVDTLHKKNLLHLGEDRYLTTIMMKHFPTFKMKFTPDAIAYTIAPDKWKILLSQRRRWINSTIHNLCEVMFLGDLCGFCCFSMRFVVFIDLLGTIILPATTVYIVYLIVHVVTTHAPAPVISLVMIGGVYALQAIIFLIKREFMLIGWMILYILAYPVYSFFLPVYSFWCMDDFSWGNTRLVVGEGANKKVLIDDEEKFDESMIPLKKFSEYEAEAWESQSRRSMDDKRSVAHSQAGSRRNGPVNRSANATPLSYHPGSQAGDYYRDTNKLNTSNSNPNLRAQSMAGLSQYGGPPQLGPVGSIASMPGMGSMPFLPFAPGPGSVVGSDYGGMHPQMGMMGMGPYGAQSIYGGNMMGPGAPRNSVMTNLNMFGGGGPGSVAGGPAASSAGGFGMMAPGAPRPMSTFSVDPFGGGGPGPSPNENPTDEELLVVLRHYLSTQDLMTVTKKTARAAVEAKFPRANLATRKEFLNKSIDDILSST